MFRRLLFLATMLFPVLAQDSWNLSVVKGMVAAEESLAGTHLTVNLIPVLTRRPLDRVYVGNDGSFEFRNVAAGSYVVELATASGDVIHQETISLTANGDRIEIRLPARADKAGAAGVVSARELRHPMTAKSRKILVEAQKTSAKGDYLKAADILRGVLNDEAAVPYARMNRGVDYLKAGQPANAVPELQEAVLLMPDDAVARTNFAYALLMLKRTDAAEIECRRALQLDKNSAKARWVMGSILLSKGSHMDEAAEDLRLASREIPKARVMLAHYYERSGQKDAAARELREFLPQASIEDRPAVVQWLNRLAAK